MLLPRRPKWKSEKKDPHAWLNLGKWYYQKNIAKRLIEKTLTMATYEKNLKAYVEKLTALDKGSQREIHQHPRRKKMIVTSEGRFKYF